MNDAAIAADGVKIVLGGTNALNGVSFTIAPGKITGLIGPSGSGKTTLMRAMVGVQAVTAGRLQIFGELAGSKELRPHIGYVPQSPAVYGDLTTAQNLEYFATIFGVSKARVGEVLKQVDLVPQAGQLVNSLSGGQLRRVSLGVALLSDAELLVLDEPTVGLDPVLREKLWTLFRELAKGGKTLIISSHVMDEAERCEDILLLREGKALSHSSKTELLNRTKAKTIEEAFLKLAGGIFA